jgi:hypothetical protein
MSTDKLIEEIDAGEGLTLAQLAKRCPRTRQGKPVSLGCVLRWVLKGARDPNGKPVCLEAARLGGKWITTPAAFRRFIERQTPRLEPSQTPRTAAKRQRAADRAARELEAAVV